MLKKLLLIIAGLWMSIGLAFADVEVNKADQAQLDSVKGIGPKISKAIVDERDKNGSFKDWDDFEKRVKGIGAKNASKMSDAGLTVNGKSMSGTSGTKTAGKGSSSSAASSGSSGSSSGSSDKGSSSDTKSNRSSGSRNASQGGAASSGTSR
ncbi:hypothetical protein E4K72_14835 [Oxalobacteraceae bacterium OM1]|nr:hypothetical protein E4K72_14835 [Oxalobacteraceae bacterium OM1]